MNCESADGIQSGERFHTQELRIALVMNGGVSLAVWIGGVSHEINRLVRGESVYGRLCDALYLQPRVDVISGTSAGGINGALLALAMSQGKQLDPLREIWLNRGDILDLLRPPTQDNPPSLLDGGYFYMAMVDAFRSIANQPGPGLQARQRVPIELTLTTTVLLGEVRDFPDDIGTLIRDVTHRGLMKFRRGPDLPDDHFASADIVAKLAAAARATASFPGAFEPFYLPAEGESVTAGGEPVLCLRGHTNFDLDKGKGRFVVDGGVLDNNPLESAIDAVFRQRAEGEVRRVLAYVVPDPGHIPDPPSQTADKIPTMVSTVLASLVNIPRVESVSDQLRAITRHNQAVARQRDERLLVARSLGVEGAAQVAEAVFPGYRLRRTQSAADYIAAALLDGAARHRDATGRGVALGRRVRERIADALIRAEVLPWLPVSLASAGDTTVWHWGLFTLQSAMSVVLDLLRRGVGLLPASRSETTEPLWRGLMQLRRRAYDLVARLDELRLIDQGHWQARGTVLAPRLAELAQGGDIRLPELLETELREWVRRFDPEAAAEEVLQPPRVFSELAGKVGDLFLSAAPLLVRVLDMGTRLRRAEQYADLATLVDFLMPIADPNLRAGSAASLGDAWKRLLTLEVVQYAFGAESVRDQYLELVQFSANVPTAFCGPDRLEEKLAGVQVAHFGAFYKRSWRINDWMFGRLDGAERIVRILLDPSRLSRLYGRAPERDDAGGSSITLDLLRAAVFDGLGREDDRTLLDIHWRERLPAMRDELGFLDTAGAVPEQLPECAAMVLERLHLDILRRELPALADAIGDDEVDGADVQGNGPKFLKRFRNALFPNTGTQPQPVATPELTSDQVVQLFKGARVGEEKILGELGSDRFTATAARAAAVAVSALAGKSSGLGPLRAAFTAVRTPLVMLDILVRALMKRGRVFVGLYAMLMAAAATVLLSGPLASAHWPSAVSTAAGLILAIGVFVLLRRNPRLLLGAFAFALLAWLWIAVGQKCFG